MNVIKSELSDEKPHFCAKCDKQICDRYFLKALNLFWHEDCLKCGCCDCRLGDVGSSLYTRENFLLCKSDYMRLYGNTGLCSACNKLIPAFEMVMRAKRNVYHLECFACQQCSHRFCVGDRFYLCENKILCENDYEERLQYFATTNANQTTTNINNNEAKSKFNDCSPTTNISNLKSLTDGKNARDFNGFGKEFAGFAIRRQSDVPIVVR
ncbi:LIM domain only protein 3 [Pseudolycoriella hygida]|uniref:LIM domain only protein 3 n=1 Tax=Pseudolycoriella hygida TaxID=35572 RepID=A0A9Q0S0J4_9DIPT|nr:LIM domain only protein 3 [Pseudolycoriella hygida]